MQNYATMDKLGSGSYSSVYKAKDLRTGELVALKIMKFPYSKGKRLQDMELAALKRFSNNPCVVRLKEHFMQKDVMVMVFELGGCTLIDYYRRLKQIEKRAMTDQQVKVIAYQIALALGEMHRSNYMHRDLKPQNILINPQTKHIKLVDFGLCKRWQTMVNTNYVTTRWYRSPELILNLPYTPNIDVFALGCVMLELYLGYEAFPGKDAIDQLNKVFSVTGTPTKQEWPQGMEHLQQKRIIFPVYEKTDLKTHMPNISQQAIDLIGKMILCNPHKRYSSKEVLSHPYFSSLHQSLLPDDVRQYLKNQHRPAMIEYPLRPLKLQLPAKVTGSTQASTSRRRKLQLVSATDHFKKKHTCSQQKIPSAGSQQHMQIHHTHQLSQTIPELMMTCQSTKIKKKINLTILEDLRGVPQTQKNRSTGYKIMVRDGSDQKPRRLDRFLPQNTMRPMAVSLNH